MIWECEAAGVMAAAAAAVVYCRDSRVGFRQRRVEAIAFEGVCIRGGMANWCVSESH